MTQTIGKITVPVAGTPIQLSAQATFQEALTELGLSTVFVKVHAIHFQALPTNSGNVYLGKSALVKASYTRVGYTFLTPTDTYLPAFGITDDATAAGVDCSAIWLDADVSGNGLSVMIEVT